MLRALADLGNSFFGYRALPHTKVARRDMWIDAESPVMTLSLRHDRIDGFGLR